MRQSGFYSLQGANFPQLRARVITFHSQTAVAAPEYYHLTLFKDGLEYKSEEHGKKERNQAFIVNSQKGWIVLFFICAVNMGKDPRKESSPVAVYFETSYCNMLSLLRGRCLE
ncbi:hypothetical protein AVEN_55851-1 [Araneus ventricosus]|uniref:Uncharacterized protein n=1 Tax=Araneus ventricosus TaxID=182803 RepID=A0A4Y2CNM1_ARAVE|nr:hypothetical protein AVEN_55851-1 [Araneus ventricosus]